MICAEGAAGGSEVPARILLPDERYDFVQHVVFILHVARDTPARWDILVVPALAIDTVDAVKLQPPTLNFVPERAHHSAIFKLEEARLRSGKGGRRQSRVSKDEQLHVASETRREPFVIFAIH